MAILYFIVVYLYQFISVLQQKTIALQGHILLLLKLMLIVSNQTPPLLVVC